MASAERDRLNRRIRILPKDKARSLKSYRQYISRNTNVRKRGVAHAFIPRAKGGYFEAVDVVSKCHEFLDNLDVPPMFEAEQSH